MSPATIALIICAAAAWIGAVALLVHLPPRPAPPLIAGECAECHGPMTPLGLLAAVRTDAGPVHRECFCGPLAPGDEPPGWPGLS
jgi:hypothetical protein